jgi:nitrogen fixation protein NifX
MRIAFATSDGVRVDQQVRRASRLDIYELGPDGPRLADSWSFSADRSVKTAERVEVLAGVEVVFGVAFSPSSAARFARAGVKPATAPKGTPIADLLERLARRAAP